MSYTRMMFTSVAIVCALAGSAMAQVDEQAKAALTDAVKAIKEAPGLSFKAKRGTEGMSQMTMGGEGMIKFVRSATPASTMSFAFKGKTDVVLEGTINRDMVLVEGKGVQWVDEKQEKIFESPMVQGSEASGVVYRVREIMIMPPLRDDEPFASELKAGKMVMEAPAVIGGEQCQVVRVVLKEGQTERLVYISALDRLPRRYEMVVYLNPSKDTEGKPQGRMAMVYEANDMKIEKMDLSKHVVGDGKTSFKREKLTPKEITAANPAPAPNPPLPNVLSAEGGLKEGSQLPNFNFAKLDKEAKPISNETISGHVSVFGFFAVKVPSSMEVLDTLAAVGDAKAYAIAARAENADAVNNAIAKRGVKWGKAGRGDKGVKDAKGGKDLKEEKGGKGETGGNEVPIGLATDMTLDQMGIRGFPAVLVVGADGRVVRYFEGNPTAEELAAAIKAAGKK